MDGNVDNGAIFIVIQISDAFTSLGTEQANFVVPSDVNNSKKLCDEQVRLAQHGKNLLTKC